MKNIDNEVFLSKIGQRINNGDFDDRFVIPFMTRKLFYTSLKGRIAKKLSTSGTPILSDEEVDDCMEETKETAANIMAVYMKSGFVARTEEGFHFTEKIYAAIKAAYNESEEEHVL